MSEPKPMDSRVLAEVRDMVERESFSPYNRIIAELLDAHDYWRGRVYVDVCDLEREGVGLAKVSAWLRAHGWIQHPWDGSQLDGWTKPGTVDSWVDTPRDRSDLGGVAASIRYIAEIMDCSQWDILAEIAAMEVSDG